MIKKISSKWYRYGGTIGFGLIYILMGIYPIFVALTSTIPSELHLTRLTVKILRAEIKHPHLIIQLPDKSTQEVDFPVNLFWPILSVPRFYGLNNEQLTRLNGSIAELRVARVEWPIPGRLRVWEIRSSQVNWLYPEAVNYYRKHNRFNWIDGLYHFFCISFFVFIFAFERKRT